MGTPLLRGRYFTDADKAGAQLVVIVNQKLAQHYWPNQRSDRQAVARRHSGDEDSVVDGCGRGGRREADLPLTSPPRSSIYNPVDQAEEAIGALASPGDLNGNGGYIVLRSALPAEQMENALRATVRIDRSATAADTGADHGAGRL